MTSIKRNTGLFFGSFNPIHVGHIMIANYMVEFEGMDEVWFVVSPQNPYKAKGELTSEIHRFNMVKIAIRDLPGISVSDIELTMPQPSYTINTLKLLKERHPDTCFHILMGSDNIIRIDGWKDSETIINSYNKIVYPRNGYPVSKNELPAKTRISQAPIVDISSTMLREWIINGHDVRTFMPAGIFEYIRKNKLFN